MFTMVKFSCTITGSVVWSNGLDIRRIRKWGQEVRKKVKVAIIIKGLAS